MSSVSASLLLRPNILAALRIERLAVVRPIREVDGDIDRFLGDEGPDLSTERHRDGALGPTEGKVTEKPSGGAVRMPLTTLGPGSVDGGALSGRSKEEIGSVPGRGGPEAPREGALQEWKQPGQRGGTDPTVREPPWGRSGRRVFLSEANSVLCGLTTVAAALGVHTESSAASPLSRENSIGNSGRCRAPEN